MSNLQTLSQPQIFGALFNCGCGVYFPGYEVHPIHARQAAGSDSWTPVYDVDARGNFITVQLADERLEKWHHHPDHVAQAVEHFEACRSSEDVSVQYCREFHLLAFVSGAERRVLNLADAA